MKKLFKFLSRASNHRTYIQISLVMLIVVSAVIVKSWVNLGMPWEAVFDCALLGVLLMQMVYSTYITTKTSVYKEIIEDNAEFLKHNITLIDENTILMGDNRALIKDIEEMTALNTRLIAQHDKLIKINSDLLESETSTA